MHFFLIFEQQLKHKKSISCFNKTVCYQSRLLEGNSMSDQSIFDMFLSNISNIDDILRMQQCRRRTILYHVKAITTTAGYQPIVDIVPTTSQVKAFTSKPWKIHFENNIIITFPHIKYVSFITYSLDQSKRPTLVVFVDHRTRKRRLRMTQNRLQRQLAHLHQ